MKKSEMINSLAIHLYNTIDTQGSFEDCEHEANLILMILEAKGMKAPLVEENPYDYMDNEYRKELNYYNSLYKWEPEDE